MISTVVHVVALTTAVISGQPRGEVLEFSASWCGPCQRMSPIVSRLERQGYPIRKVDVDANRALAERYGITNIPAFVLIIDGREVQRAVGAMSEQDLVTMLNRIPTEPEAVTVSEDQRSRAPLTDERTRSLDQPPRPQSRALTQPVAAVDEQPASRSRGAADSADHENKPSLLEKLFGQGKSDSAAPAADVVRANLDSQPAQPGNLLPVRNPVEASVRLHVTINGQKQMGSGTAIDSRQGQTLIVTCGHLFNGWNDRSKVEVDLFVGKEMQRFVGRMVHYDVVSDVGVIGIPTDTIIPTAEIAPVSARPQVGDAVVTIGCSGGAAPTQEQVQVTALNFYEGPDNIECTGVPVQGRSGGGLFNRQGQLVGLCIAADADRQRGAYAGLLAVHDLLTATGLRELFEPATVPNQGSPADFGATATNPVADTSPSSPPAATNPVPVKENVAAAASDASLFETPDAQVTHGTAAGDAEVICIIRSRQTPDAPSRVVIIDRPSAKFLSYLDGEMAARHTAVRTNRLSPALSSQPSTATPRASTTTRFSAPGQTAPAAGSAPAEQSRMASLQPTSLSQPFRAQQYVRSPHAR